MSAVLNRRPYEGVLDTAESFVIVHGDETKIDTGGLRKQRRNFKTIRGEYSANIYGPLEFSMTDGQPNEVHIHFSEDKQFAEATGVSEDHLVVGHCALEHTVVRINVRTAAVELVESLSDEFGTVRLVNNPTPQVPVVVAGTRESQFLLDTGSTVWVSVNEKRLTRMLAEGRAGLLEERSVWTPLGIQRMKLYVVEFVDFAGIRFHNVPAIVSELETIGLGLLSHFDITLDYPNQRAKFTPLELNRDRMPLDASGLRVVFRENGDFVVRRLVPGYPAEKAGFKVGDRIVDFDGRKPETLWRHEIDDILSKSGETIQLTIERDGEEKVIPLKLQYPFVYPPVWEDPAKLFNPESN
ncbi:MAG: PDZ domain-containing protein [Planctomycetaceae bacterium]